MKLIVVTSDSQWGHAMPLQWQHRGRVCEVVAASDLFEGEVADKIVALAGEAVFLAPPAMIGSEAENLRWQALAEKLANYSQQHKRPLFLLSSALAFDQQSTTTRHREQTDIAPASALATAVLAMERQVRAHCELHIILRSGRLFSQWHDQVLSAVLAQFTHGGQQLFSDAGRAAPTHVGDIARVVSAMVDQIACGAEVWGTYHYSSSDPVTRFRFAEAILAVSSQYIDVADTGLELVAVEQVDSEWSLPLLNCEKILNTFGIKQLPWRSYIVPTINQFFEAPEEDADHE